MESEDIKQISPPSTTTAAIVAGQIAYVRSCGEPAFVIEVRPIAGTVNSEGWGEVKLVGFSGQEVLCRVPKLGEDGIRHETERFLYEELETREARVKQELSEILGHATIAGDSIAELKGPKLN